MINYEDFKKYFSKNFWKAFGNVCPVFSKISANAQNQITKSLHEEIENRSYYPSTPKTYLYSNKGSGVTRTIPVFEVKDYCLYYYCIKRLEARIAVNRIENTFGGWSLGGLMRKSEDEEITERAKIHHSHEEMVSDGYDVSISEYSFNPIAWSKWYGDFNSKLFATAQESAFEWVVEFDISNFYDCIRLDLLEIWIREISDKNTSEDVSLLFHFLNYWNRRINAYNKQTVGIPQDALADCSRILANFYLQQYDAYVADICSKFGCRYLRYADDQFIFGENKETLQHVIFLVSKKITHFGLNINQKKVDYRTVSDLIKHRSFEIFDNVTGDKAKDVTSVEKFLDEYFQLRELSTMEGFKNRGLPLLNKAIYCNLKDVSVDRKHKIIGYLLEDTFLIQAKSDKFARLYELLQSRSHKAGLIKKLEILSGASFHTVFHYEILKFFQKISYDKTSILTRIKEIEKE